VVSCYEEFIVTSQYSLTEIFGDDDRTMGALKRRFKVIHMINPFPAPITEDNVE